ncbi:ATP-binding cassette domain-containing protein [Helcobacillus massiliensis]
MQRRPGIGESTNVGARRPAGLHTVDRMLTATDLTIGYGDTDPVIQGLDLTADPGDIIAVTGANGSGKSTLLRGLAGHQPLDSGTILLDGADLTANSRAHRRDVFAVLDGSAWMRELTLGDHLRILETDGSLMSADDAIHTLDLADLADRHPHTFSSGQRQRSALATALVRPWSVLILDEPEQRLDVDYQERTADILRAIAPGAVIILATHSQQLIDRLGAAELHLS